MLNKGLTKSHTNPTVGNTLFIISQLQQQQHAQCNPQVRSAEGRVHAGLPLPCRDRQVVSNRPLA